MEFNRLMTGNEANALAVAELSEFVEGEFPYPPPPTGSRLA